MNIFHHKKSYSMSRRFIGRETKIENPLMRLAILEEQIAELNRKIAFTQSKQIEWKQLEVAYCRRIATKYEYHDLLYKQVYPDA